MVMPVRGKLPTIAGLAFSILALAAPGASATKTVSPTSYDFGALPIGTKSVERAFTLTATCNPSSDGTIPCQFFESWDVQPSIVGDFAIEGDNCPNPFLTGDNTMLAAAAPSESPSPRLPSVRATAR